MKLNLLQKKLTLFFSAVFLALGITVEAQTAQKIELTGGTGQTFTVPCGVTNIKIRAIGGGGAGASSNNTSQGNGGGGGGAYAEQVFTVSPGETLTYTVGSGGTSSLIVGSQVNGTASRITGTNVNLVAAGGFSAIAEAGTGGAGGSVGNSIGTIKFAGGNGGDGIKNGGAKIPGGGGASGNSIGAGNPGSAPAGGAAAGTYGGAGGAGVDSGNGIIGGNYGGGGGGTNTQAAIGGSGGNGIIVLEYTLPATPVITVQPVTPPSYCLNTAATALSVSATGQEPFSYQWYSSNTNDTTGGVAVTGATSATFTPPTTTEGPKYYYVIVSGTAPCYTVTSAIVKVEVGEKNVWNGTSWSAGGPNKPNYNAVINANYNTTSGNIEACNCTVNSPATLTIAADTYATIQNNITNNGTLVVESDGNLKQINPAAVNTGNINVKRAFTLTDARKEYNFLSSPVKGQDMFTIFGATVGTIPYVTVYNEATDYFVRANRTTDWAIPGRGFSVKEPILANVTSNNATATYTGEPNNGNIDVPLAWTAEFYGFNVIGNPYPSNVDIQQVFLNSTVNTGTTTDPVYTIDPTFRFWDNKANNEYTQMGADYVNQAYAVYNAHTDMGVVAPGYDNTAGNKTPTKNVKVDQAFMMQALAPNLSMKFTNAARVTDNTTSVFFGKETGRNIFYLEMITPAGSGMQSAIAYLPEVATNAFGGEDTEVLNYEASDALYSILDDANVIINARGAFSADDVIAIGTAHFNKGSHTIRAIDLQGIFATGQAIYLKDKVTNIITDISKKAYTFDAAEGESNNRFEIVYQSEALATDNVAKGGLVVYKEGNSFFVRGGKKMRTVEVYDATGRMVKTSPATSDNLEIVADSFTRGLYVLKVKYDDGTVQTKKVLK